jgi:hypothetical protein
VVAVVAADAGDAAVVRGHWSRAWFLPLRYVVSGSVAAIFCGEPRLTHDVDFVVFLNAHDIQTLRTAFPATESCLPSILKAKRPGRTSGARPPPA